MTMIADERTPDTRWGDPLNHHPGSPRWIFHDDIRPTKDEREILEALLDAEQLRCARRGPDWVDPRIDQYHIRIAIRRKEIWLANWYKRNASDPRVRLIQALTLLDLKSSSVTNRICEGLKEFLTPGQIEIAWSGLSPLKAIRSALLRPETPTIVTKTLIPKIRFETKRGGEAWELTRLIEVQHQYYSTQTESVADPSALSELANWTQIHDSMGYPKIPYDTEHLPSTRTLYSNPDGSRILNTGVKERSPIQAKKKFAERHNLPEERVMVERVHMVEWNEERLKKHNLTPSQCGNHLFVVSARKLSNETPSSYCDINPSFIDSLDEDGNTLHEYRYASGSLQKVIADIIPHGGHRLTIREYEYALLSGCCLSEDEIDDFANGIEATTPIHDNHDDRLYNEDDGLPHRSIESLCEEEQLLHEWLGRAGLESLAKMLTIDYRHLPKDDPTITNIEERITWGKTKTIPNGPFKGTKVYDPQDTEVSMDESQATATILNQLKPRADNPDWVSLRDYIYLTMGKKNPHAHRIVKSLIFFLSSAEAAASRLPGN